MERFVEGCKGLVLDNLWKLFLLLLLACQNKDITSVMMNLLVAFQLQLKPKVGANLRPFCL